MSRLHKNSDTLGFPRVERLYGSFQRALNLPDDANQDSKREASASKHGRSIPIDR
jgi:HSP20 family protein